jgi:hypothetical protein
LGWFVSYADQVNPRIVLVILMRGQSSRVKGPFAAGIAGRMYHTLKLEGYLPQNSAVASTMPAAAPIQATPFVGPVQHVQR